MISPHDFSRRFFADFIASRIRELCLDEGGARPATSTPAAAGDDVPDLPESESLAPSSIEEAGGLIPGLGSPGA